jgi:tRNA dimethylallyltransferase
MINPYNLIAVIGPTASGKTALAALLASRINGEVISADSRQVYRRMNLGTGKDYADYMVGDTLVPFHLVDIADPGYRYSVYEYQRDFFRVFSDIQGRGNMPVLCGGSGMYIDAATRGYRLVEVPQDEALRSRLEPKSTDELRDMLASMKTLHNKTDLDTRERIIRAIEIESYYRGHQAMAVDLPPVHPVFIGIRFDRPVERARITERLRTRLEQGMVEEVSELLGSGTPPETLVYYGLEYRYITRFLAGEMDYSTMFNQLNTAIHQFAKRQMTWFRKMEREGVRIHWINGELPLVEKLETVLQLIDR